MSESYVLTEVEQKQQLLQQMQNRFNREREIQKEQLRQTMMMVAAAAAAVKKAYESRESSKQATSTRLSGLENVASADRTVTGFDDSFIKEQNSNTNTAEVQQISIRAFDFSGTTGKLLVTNAQKKETYADSLFAQLSIAVPLEAEDAMRMGKFSAYVRELLEDQNTSADYFVQLVEARWQDLLTHIEFLDPENDPTIEEYNTLCALVGEKKRMLKKDGRKSEIKRLQKKYEKQAERDYVYQNLTEVFEELGMQIGDEMVLDGVGGCQVLDNEISNCSVFMSSDGDGILFEPIVETETKGQMSADERHRVEESTLKICAKQKEVRRKMAERGILVHVYSEATPSADMVRRVKRSGGQRRKESRQASMSLGDE